jgi:hypothetical protein
MTFRDDMDKLLNKLPNGTGEPTVEELFPDAFLRRNSSFATVQEFLAAGAAQAGPDGAKQNTPEWNTFVTQTTRFASWKEMAATAYVEYLKR